MKLAKFGPMLDDHPYVSRECPACYLPFKPGAFVTLVPIGPGDDPARQRAARESRPYMARTVIAHWSCATGFSDSED